MLATLALSGVLAFAGDGVAREWSLRAWALAPGAHRSEIDAALDDPVWDRRHAGLDAMERAAPEELPAEARARGSVALADPHPNVRQRGLALLRALGDEVAPEVLAPLADDAFAGVRLELVELLRFAAADPAHDALLLRLTRDPDRRVARAAAAALLQRGPASVEAQLELTAELRARHGFEGELFALELVERAPANAPLLEARIAARDPALWRALALARLGSGEARQLADGWFGREAGLDRDMELARRALLVRAARAFDAEVVRHLMVAALALDRAADGESDALAEWPGLQRMASERDPRELALELLAGALAAGDGASRVVLEVLPELSSSLRVVAWEGLLGRELAWQAAGARAALEPDPDARFAAVSGLAEQLARTKELDAGDALAGFLADPDAAIRAEAFRALAGSGEERWHVALFEAWRAQGPRERGLSLRELSRATAPLPFRDELVAMWQEPRVRNASVLELLAAFRDDEELGRLMTGWLETELDWLARHEPPPEEVTSGPWRASEERAKAIAGALARAEEDRSVAALERALAATDGRSEEVAKTVAALLGRTAVGRARLAEWMQGDASARVRIEAALQVARDHPSEAVALLIAQYATCDEELRVRTLRKLGALEDPRGAPFCAQVARAPGHAAPERVVALEALAASPDGEGARRGLVALLDSAPDLDVLRGAIAALGERGDTAALESLRALAADAVRREHLYDELLPALARLDPRGTARDLLAEPLAAAHAELEGRFHGARLPAREFVWRGEIAAAEHLARAGELDAALAAAGPWWRLDARLCVALGDAALASGQEGARASARRLFHAARVGFAGEPPTSDLEGQRTRARARGLALALEDGRWREARRLARELLAGWRSGQISRREWEEVLGRADLATERDPLARVEASELQASAWIALARGERERARELAARAASVAARSWLARRQQLALDEALR